MSIYSTVIALPGRPAAERVATTIRNVAALPVGADTSFGLGIAHIEVIRPREGYWMISAIEVVEDYSEIRRLRTVAVVPSEYRNFDVVAGSGGLIHGEFRGIEAAIGLALERAGAAALADRQHEHDACGC